MSVLKVNFSLKLFIDVLLLSSTFNCIDFAKTPHHRQHSKTLSKDNNWGRPTPYHALVVYSKFYCSGAVIGSRMVITTAYCFVYQENGIAKGVAVKVGADTIAGEGHVIGVVEIKVHEYFNRRTPMINDIALVCLETHTYLNIRVKKVILVEPDVTTVPGSRIKVTSWISNATKREYKRQLTTEMVVTSKAYCASKFEGYFTTSSFCARYRRGKNIADTGGPAVHNQLLVGIMSYTEKVDDVYTLAVFTNISRFHRWIRKNTIELLSKYCAEDLYDYYDPNLNDDMLHYFYDISGVELNLKEAAYSAQFFNANGYCGSVVVTSWAILTAAHCFGHNIDVDEMYVRVGFNGGYKFDDPRAETHQVLRVEIHEKYDKSVTFSHDIALAFLKNHFKLRPLVQRVLLGTSADFLKDFTPNAFRAAGWGLTSYPEGELSNDGLKAVNLTLVDLHRCAKIHNVTMSHEMFCLYGGQHRDTCKGDSGGGVIWRSYLVGIVSHGDGCGEKDKPSVYTNVLHFNSWIKDKLLYFKTHYCEPSKVSERLLFKTTSQHISKRE